MDFQRAIKEMLLGVKIARINGNKIFYYQQFVKPDGTEEYFPDGMMDKVTEQLLRLI